MKLMKIFIDPITTTSLPVLMFAAEHANPIQISMVRLLNGEHLTAEYGALNPNRCVPTLQDEDFVLTEASAILKYLADKLHSPTYPRELRARARVNQAMDWFNTGFYRDVGYGAVYPRLVPEHAFANPTTQADVLRRAEGRTAKWFSILNNSWLRGSGFLCGSDISIADYLGSSYVAITELVGLDLTPYSNVRRWMSAMQARPGWREVHGEWNAFCDSVAPRQTSAPIHSASR
jgi:glutathione S-transferase